MESMRSTLLMLLGLSVVVMTGCETTECGDGTLFVDGVCVAADSNPDPSTCGVGTHFEITTGQCEPDGPPTECGPNTIEEIQPDGTVLCVGVGGAGCGAPIPCPTPDGNKTTVCGQIYNIEDGQPFAATGASGAPCNPSEPTTDGPCSLTIGAFSPIEFIADPTGAQTLAADEYLIDDCGRFRAVNLPVPTGDVVTIGTGDATDNGDLRGNELQDIFVAVGAGFEVTPGQATKNGTAIAMYRTTDQAWTISAGGPFGGETLSEIGIYVAVFFHADTPVSGVQVTANNSVFAGQDHYFADADTDLDRITVDPGKSATGPNGTALLENRSAGLQQHSGTGNEPAGCEWPSGLGAAVAGVVFYQERHAHVVGEPDTPCPK